MWVSVIPEQYFRFKNNSMSRTVEWIINMVLLIDMILLLVL